MTDIVEFLTARLDEDEAIATAAKWKHWVPGSGLHPASVETAEPQAGWHGERATVANLMATVGKVQRERQHAVHIARHDPARVLREAAAKRKLLEWCAKAVGSDWSAYNEDRPLPEQIQNLATNAAIDMALRVMAAPYADHSDYDPDWRMKA